MKQGTTPTHTFVLPFDASVIEKVRIIYAQDEEVKLTVCDVSIEGNTITARLTQEDTLKLECGKFVEVQVRVLTPARRRSK